MDLFVRERKGGNDQQEGHGRDVVAVLALKNRMNPRKIQKREKQTHRARVSQKVFPVPDQREHQQKPQAKPPEIRSSSSGGIGCPPLRMRSVNGPVNPRFVRAEENVLLLYGKLQETQWVGTDPFLSPCKAHLIPTNLITQIRRKITLSSRGPRTRRQRIVRSVENISAVCGHGNECAQHTIIPNRPRRYRDDQKKRCQCEALPSLAFTSRSEEHTSELQSLR